MKTIAIFAPELTVRQSIKALIIAVFFISANNSLDCCLPSGSRYIALLTVSHNQGNNSLFFINLIFNPTMRQSIKNEGKEKNIILPSTPSGATSGHELMPIGAESPAEKFFNRIFNVFIIVGFAYFAAHVVLSLLQKGGRL